MKLKLKKRFRQLNKITRKKATYFVLLTAFLLGYAFNFYPHSEKYLRARVVELVSSDALCSGEQIHSHGKDYILTASHCKMLANSTNEIMVIDAKGNHIFRKVIAEDPSSDLLLLEGLPNLRGIEIASFDWIGEYIRTFTHGLGRPTYETEGRLEGSVKISAILPYDDGCTLPKEAPATVSTPFGNITIDGACIMSVTETKTDAASCPGSSGGMAVNSFGHLAGVVSAGDYTMTGLVSLKDIRHFLAHY